MQGGWGGWGVGGGCGTVGRVNFMKNVFLIKE